MAEPIVTTPVFQAPLPSQDAAYRLVRGEPNGVRDSAGCLLARAALISCGLAVVGERGRGLVVKSLAASTAIELFVIGWTFAHREVAL